MFRGADFPAPAIRVALGGALLGLSFPPYPFAAVAWIALVPLISAWRNESDLRRAYVEAYLTFQIMFAVAFWWPLAHHRLDTALLSLPGLIVVPMWMALPFPAALAIRRHLGTSAGIAALFALFLLMEGALTYGPLAFPWSLLGHTQATLSPFNRLAAIGGVPLLTLWVLLANGLIAEFFLAQGNRRTRVGLAAVAGALMLAVAFETARPSPLPVRHVRLGLVQPAMHPAAWADVRDESRIDTLLALSSLLTEQRPDLVIWPESALPVLVDPVAQERMYGRLHGFAAAYDFRLLTGAIIRDSRGGHANSALLFGAGGRVDGADYPPARYDKVKLVPFAERVPFVEHFPWLRAMAIPAGGVSEYVPGVRQDVLAAPELRLGTLICFESLFGNYARRYIEQEADLLVALTQDGWWGETPGYRQHLAFTRLRAIETGRAVVQVAVTGTTAVLLPDGTSSLKTAWMKRAALPVDVPVFDSRTFYVRHGDWATTAALPASILLIALAVAGRLGWLRTRTD